VGRGEDASVTTSDPSKVVIAIDSTSDFRFLEKTLDDARQALSGGTAQVKKQANLFG